MPFKISALCALMLLPSGQLAAAEKKVVAILTSASGAYLEAFSAFQEKYGEKITFFDISKEHPAIPPGTRTVVAFGTKAASRSYPPSVNLVYTLAPGYYSQRSGSVKVSMSPPPKMLVEKIRELHPSLKSLRIFWRSPWYAGLGKNYSEEGKRSGLSIRTVKVDRDSRLPALLRASLGNTDAIWLPPDPLLISRMTLKIFSDFARANSIPIYASATGLAKRGACAAIGPSFVQLGSAAADAAKDMEKGKKLAAVIHSMDFRMTLNLKEAKNCGLIFSAEAIRKADNYYP